MLASLARGISVAAVIQVIGAALVYLMQVLLARWMGSSQYGVYSYVITWATLLAIPGGLGLATAVLRYLPEYSAKKDWARFRGMLNKSQSLTLMISVVISLLGTVLVLLLNHYNRQEYAVPLLLGIWLVPMLAYSELQSSIARGFHRIALSLTPPYILRPILLIMGAFLISRQFFGLNAKSALAMTAASLVLTIVVQSWMGWRAMPTEATEAHPTYVTREWMHVTLPLLLTSGFVLIINQSDILIVGSLLGARQAGIYTAATKTAMLPRFVLSATSIVVAPMIASLYASGDKSALQRLVSVSIRWMFWPSFAFAAFLMLLGGPVLGLFGPGFAAGRWVLAILAVGRLLDASTGPVGYLMNLTGHQGICARVYGWSALIDVLLNAILIPHYGLIGAALANAGTTILWNLWLAALVQRRLEIRSLMFMN